MYECRNRQTKSTVTWELIDTIRRQPGIIRALLTPLMALDMCSIRIKSQVFALSVFESLDIVGFTVPWFCYREECTGTYQSGAKQSFSLSFHCTARISLKKLQSGESPDSFCFVFVFLCSPTRLGLWTNELFAIFLCASDRGNSKKKHWLREMKRWLQSLATCPVFSHDQTLFLYRFSFCLQIIVETWLIHWLRIQLRFKSSSKNVERRNITYDLKSNFF